MVVANFTEQADTLVIGAGPGGYVAAIRAAQEGQDVVVVEKEATLGGVCLNVGCIPSKALIHAADVFEQSKESEVFGIKNEKTTIDWQATQKWKQEKVVDRMTGGIEYLFKKNKIKVVRGTAYFTGKNAVHVDGEEPVTYEFKNAIIATGSTPIQIPGFEWSERVIDSTGGLALPEIPKKLVVVGGGYIGSVLAGVYSKFGTEITILEGSPSLLGGYDKDMVALVEKSFKSRGAKIVKNAMAKKAEKTDKGVKVTYEADGKTETVEADYCLVTVGRYPNTRDLGLEAIGVELDDRNLIKVDEQGRTTVDHIFAIGDIVPGAALAHKASYEGKIAAEAIAGKKVAVDYRAMPAVAFTTPELASVGYTETEAKEAGLEDVKASKFPLAGNGRAVSLNAMDGFVRLITAGPYKTIVGAQVAGPHSSDLISELAVAVEGGLSAEDIALTIHPHPTLGEAIMDTAELALGQPIHI